MIHPENDSQYAGLTVNAGVEGQPIVNPYFRPAMRKPRENADYYIAGILRGDKPILAKAVTLVESNLVSDQQIAQKVIEGCLPYSGKSIRVGVTGVPGAGKSTFIEALGNDLCKKGRKLAVLAIDPSSERSRGSILGDKTRMQELSANKDAFIRPSPSAGSLGGVARKTRETIVLCEAAGYDTILVETVGVGQSETAAHSMVDFFLLLQVTGTGDELQGIKRGIMEMADGIAINKCDGNNVEKASVAKTQFQNALALFPPTESGWKPYVTTCSAVENTGIEETWKMVEDYIAFAKQNHFFDINRTRQSKYWMHETITQYLLDSFYHNPVLTDEIEKAEQRILDNKESSFIAAHKLIQLYADSQHK